MAGARIEAPEGGRAVTRPTTGPASRASMASQILSACGLDLTGRSVLDAFAGSGAMGLELVSRGAARATFVDRDRRAVARLRRSLTPAATDGEVAALAGDVFSLAPRGLPGAPFDVVFLDPPYALSAERVSSLVDVLARGGQLAPGAVVVYEHAADAPGLDCDALGPARSRTHGITAVDLMVARTEGDTQ